MADEDDAPPRLLCRQCGHPRMYHGMSGQAYPLDCAGPGIGSARCGCRIPQEGFVGRRAPTRQHQSTILDGWPCYVEGPTLVVAAPREPTLREMDVGLQHAEELDRHVVHFQNTTARDVSRCPTCRRPVVSLLGTCDLCTRLVALSRYRLNVPGAPHPLDVDADATYQAEHVRWLAEHLMQVAEAIVDGRRPASRECAACGHVQEAPRSELAPRCPECDASYAGVTSLRATLDAVETAYLRRAGLTLDDIPVTELRALMLDADRRWCLGCRRPSVRMTPRLPLDLLECDRCGEVPLGRLGPLVSAGPCPFPTYHPVGLASSPALPESYVFCNRCSTRHPPPACGRQSWGRDDDLDY